MKLYPNIHFRVRQVDWSKAMETRIKFINRDLYEVEAYCILFKDLGQETDENDREKIQGKISV